MTTFIPTAMVLADNNVELSKLIGCLKAHGLAVSTTDEIERTLEICSQAPPNLMIVQKEVCGDRGVKFLSELVKISWTTSTILITDQDEAEIHDQTEGLGILGSIKTADDIINLQKLVARFLELCPSKPLDSNTGLNPTDA